MVPHPRLCRYFICQTNPQKQHSYQKKEKRKIIGALEKRKNFGNWVLHWSPPLDPKQKTKWLEKTPANWTDWLTDWSTEELTDWLKNWLTDNLRDHVYDIIFFHKKQKVEGWCQFKLMKMCTHRFLDNIIINEWEQKLFGPFCLFNTFWGTSLRPEPGKLLSTLPPSTNLIENWNENNWSEWLVASGRT